MKKLFLLIFFSGSLTAISQETKLKLGDMGPVLTDSLIRSMSIRETFKYQTGISDWEKPVVLPDTLRAICLVTLFPNGPAHARMGYVVIQPGKRTVYLDCQKKALKQPQVGWGWVEVSPNSNK